MQKEIKENSDVDSLTRSTIDDFGAQWQRYTTNEGYYASKELLEDILNPFVKPRDIVGKIVGEIGSGTGRIVDMLLQSGAKSVVAVEPSVAVEVLKRNTEHFGEKVQILNMSGDSLPDGLDLDYVFSIGVLHHIPEPEATVAAAFRSLKPGGRMLIWLYGHEGNEVYLRYIVPLRAVTTLLPDVLLIAVCHLLNVFLGLYIFCCRFVRLPLASYIRNVLGKFSWHKRYLVIFDQLNPAYAKYYKRNEALELLESAGFCDVSIHHRHEYSWTVIGTRP